MVAPEPPRDALAQARATAAQRLAEKAAVTDTPLDELRDLHERLRLIDAGLAARPAPPRPQRWPAWLLPALLIAGVLSVAGTLQVPAVPFTLELRARSATLGFDAAGELEAQPVDGVLRLEGQTRVEAAAAASAPLAQAAARGDADPVVLRAPQLLLRRLAYPSGAVLGVGAGAQVPLTLEAPQGPLVAELEFAGPTTWRIGSEESAAPQAHDHAEWLRASAEASAPGQRPPPLTLWLGRSATREYHWTGLRPTTLQFVARHLGSGAAPTLGSSLEQAQIGLPATGAQVTLAAGDRLELAGLVLERFELGVGESVSLKLAGTARVLTTRTGDFERSLKPSWLEFIARHHTVGLLWSAALLLWGAISWVRKQLAATA